jgi:adenylate cyclase class 2
MLEVEVKYPVADFAPLERRLRERGARPAPPIDEADHYFNAPDRDFAQTDEALRLRRIGPANRVTYKGPRRDPRTKTRTEIEIPLGEGDQVASDFTQLLTQLGYRSVAVVKKRRQIYALDRDGFAIEVCLDEVAEVGRFAELEIQAPEDGLDAAREVLLCLAGELGLTNMERRSYLELLLGKRR